MSAWVVIPAALKLRDQYNQVAPLRDKGSDGTIGDSNHTSSSDHTPDEDSDVLRGKDADTKNEVHAVDIDSTGPWPDGKGGEAGGWFDRSVKFVVADEKRRWLDANDVCRLEYAIWRGKIYSRQYDFAERTYTGSDGHYGHAHFSFRYLTQSENDTRDYPLEGDDVTKEECKAAVLEVLKSSDGAMALLRGAFRQDVLNAPDGLTTPENPEWTGETYLSQIAIRADNALKAAKEAERVSKENAAVLARIEAVLGTTPAKSK